MSAFSPPLSIKELVPIFHKYKIDKPLDGGGQAGVFAVTLPQGNKGALKIYNLERVCAKRVENEIDALKQLKSNVIVKLISYGLITLRDLECIYVVYEYIEGDNVKTLISQGPLGERLIMHLCCRISRAIEEMWTLRIVHRDIKPANILVSKDGLVYLIDLGVAKHYEKDKVTDTGWTLGTPGYMSPEQAAGLKLSYKSDIFSLGIVAYEALTGIHPFNHNQSLVGKIRPNSIKNYKQVDADLIVTVDEMLQFHPVLRPSYCTIYQKMKRKN